MPLVSAVAAAYMVGRTIFTDVRSKLTAAQDSGVAGRWRRPISIMVALLILTWVPSVITYFGGAPTSAPAPSTLHDDATKWKIAKNLHALAMTEHGPIRGTCEVVVVRYQLPYAEKMFLELRDVFDVIGWRYHEDFATSTLPNGLSLKAVQGDISSNCMSLFKEQLSANTTRVTPSSSFVENPRDDEHMKKCSGPCFEIDIGNEPD